MGWAPLSELSYFDGAASFAGLPRPICTLTGLLALTRRASFDTMWLRRMPVRRALVRFLGFPTKTTPFYWLLGCGLCNIISVKSLKRNLLAGNDAD